MLMLVWLCSVVVGSSFFLFKQKTAYEMRISDWSSDVCSSDLGLTREQAHAGLNAFLARQSALGRRCVLVITGKGRPDWQRPDWGSGEREIGVIRRALPGWLADHPNKDRVLAFAAAQDRKSTRLNSSH